MAKPKKATKSKLTSGEKVGYILLLILGVLIAAYSAFYCFAVSYLLLPGVTSSVGYFFIYTGIMSYIELLAVGIVLIILSIISLAKPNNLIKKAFIGGFVLSVFYLILDLIFDYFSYLNVLQLNILADLVLIVVFFYLMRRKN